MTLIVGKMILLWYHKYW